MDPLNRDDLINKYEQLTDAQKMELAELIEGWERENRAKGRPNRDKTHRVVGRLLFEYDGSDGNPIPLHHMPIEVWDRDPIGPDDFLGRCETDSEGHIEIWYNPADAFVGDIPDIELRIFEPYHIYSPDGEREDLQRLVHIIDLEDDISVETYDIGTHRIPYWEYASNSATPRVLIPEEGGPPQAYSPGRSMYMIKTVTPVEVIKRKHFLINQLNSELPALETIQNDYPENLTRMLEKERPGTTRSDEYFGEQILNGMVASVLDKDPQNPDRYWLYHQWNSYEQDGLHAMPNVDMRFEVRDEKLWPIEITLHMRQPGATAAGSPVEKLKFTPDDSEKWLQAKRVARVSSALSAELDTHLITTHLNLEQYAIPFYRNIRKNPVRYLLSPHLKEVVLINHAANNLLLEESGHITAATGFTVESINQRMTDVLGTLNWKNWQPRKPICEAHRYAKVATQYWNILTDYVDQFFDKNLQGIIDNWVEIQRFSNDLVENSVPLFMCGYLRSMLLDDSSKKDRSWYAQEERIDLETHPIRTGKGGKAVQAITTVVANPSLEEIENLKQVCRYTIMHATFSHSWANDRQFDEGGEILYTSLGLRYGENGILAPESDMSIAPTPRIATEQIWISYLLSHSGFGFILKNEDKDIHPIFQRLLRIKRKAFAELDFDISRIQSRINI